MATAQRKDGILEKTGTPLYVLPTFLGSQGLEHGLPRDKRWLHNLVKTGTAKPANLCACGDCHGPTKFGKWFKASDAYQVDFEWFFEPYFVAPKSLSQYDERFMGYGNDKQSKIFMLFNQGAYFIVLPNSFQVHQYHEASKIWNGPCETKMDNQEFGDKDIHQVMCGYIEEVRQGFEEERAMGKKLHENVKLATQLTASHFCWAPRCPGNVRTRVSVNDEWYFTVHTYHQITVSHLMEILEARTGPLERLEIFLGQKSGKTVYRTVHDALPNVDDMTVKDLRAQICQQQTAKQKLDDTRSCSNECGPTKNNQNCCANNPYCNEASGWCGTTAAHRDAQPGDMYDYGSKGSSCESASQWTTSGYSSIPLSTGFKSAGTLHLRVHKKMIFDAGYKVHNQGGGLQSAAQTLPDGSALALLGSPQRSLDLSGFTSIIISKQDLHGKLDKGFTISLWMLPEGIGQGAWAQASVFALGRELSMLYNCWGGLAVERVHIKNKGLENLNVCGFDADHEPAQGKKLERGKWHFIVFTMKPTPEGGYRAQLVVNGHHHFEATATKAKYTIMGVDFWRAPNCVADKYKRPQCPRFETRFSLGRDVGEPGQGFEGKFDDVTIWGRGLYDKEIKDLYYKQDGIPDYKDKSLLGAWDFDDMDDKIVDVQNFKRVKLIKDRSHRKNDLILRSSFGDFPTPSTHVRGTRQEEMKLNDVGSSIFDGVN